jgi:hypothetical protein
MAKAVIPVAEADATLFRELLDSTDLADNLGESAHKTSTGPVVHFSLDVGIGNGINYFFLGKAWQALLMEKEKAGETST